ncbi:MAG: phosphoglucosamine mutase, partial [Sulfolobaceae archaeon]
DLGVAHDGDADRAIFIDSLGRIQWGDRSGTLLAEYAWNKEKGGTRQKVVVTAVSSSGLVEEYLSPKSFRIVWTPVGSIGIAYKLKQENGIAGFEENGGFIFPPHQYVRDGGMTFALMLELLAIENISSAELFNKLPNYYPLKTKIPLNKVKNVNKLYEDLIRIYGNKGTVITIDGVKVIGKDFWFLVRKSGTEPILRIMLEAKDVESAQKLLSEIQKLALEGS